MSGWMDEIVQRCQETLEEVGVRSNCRRQTRGLEGSILVTAAI